MLAKKTIEKKEFERLGRFGRSGLLRQSQKTAPSQRFIAKYVLGTGQYKSKPAKILSLSWRFATAFFFVFYLVTGIGPLDFYFKSIGALGSISDPKIQTIAFYSGEANPDKVSEDFELGWWNSENSKGAPNINSNGGLFLFSPDNSSFYSGGDYSMIIGNFAPEEGVEMQNDEIITEELLAEDGQYIETAPEEEIKSEADSLDEPETNFEIFNDEDKVQGAQSDSEAEIIEVSQQSGDELENQEGGVDAIVIDEAAPDADIEIKESEDGVGVEIIDTGGAESAQDGDGDLSLAGKIIKYFRGKEAIAGDGEGAASMDKMFGKFRSARIKISLAFGSNKKGEALLESEKNNIKDIEIKSEANDLTLGQTEESINDIEEDMADEQVREIIQDMAEDTEQIIKETEEEASKTEEIVNPDESESKEAGVEIITEEDNAEIITVEDEIEVIEENNGPLSVIYDFFETREASAAPDDARLVIWYTLDDLNSTSSDPLWRKLDTVYGDNFSNAAGNGYLSYEMPFVNGWHDVDNLKIKVEGLSEGKSHFVVYLDSVWVEIDYEADKSKAKTETGKIMEMLSYKLDFKIDEEGEFRFKYNKEKSIMDSISRSFGFSNYWSDVNLKIEIRDSGGSVVDIPLTVFFEENGEFLIKLPEQPRNFKPGQYTIKFYIEDLSGGNPQFINFEQDFSWGVLALNIDKSIYTIDDDSSYIQMGVLDNEGHTVCDGELFLEIYSPENDVTYLSTEDGSIIKNSDCGMDNVIDTPDYYTHYMLYGEGRYEIRLFASTTNGIRETGEVFEVKNAVPFEVERIGPSRINPTADYKMTLNIKANRDFDGSVIDYVREDFFIKSQSLEIKNASSGIYALYNDTERGTRKELEFSINRTDAAQALKWTNLNLSEGDELRINYVFDAPNVSPEFYLIGPFQFADTRAGDMVFEEARKWQIASDAIENLKANGGINYSWLNGGSAFDVLNNNTYATRDILKKTGTSPETTLYLEMTSNNAVNMGGVIKTVEIGVEGHVQNAALTAYVKPYFNASVLGSQYTVPALGTTADVDTPRYVNITNDTARPAYPAPWTWQEIIDLHAQLYGGNGSNSTNYTMSIDMIHIRVDYDPNNAPTSTIESAVQKIDTSGAVDMTISVGDLDGDNDVRAKLEYEAGASCLFSPGLDPTLDETDASATSTYADAKIDNGGVYQIGSSTGWIETATGTNYVNFDWLSSSDLNNQEGEYCLRLTAFDGDDVQTAPATGTVMIDNKAPSSPGVLIATSTSKNEIEFEFGATSTDSHFNEYVIYWKIYDGAEVTEADTPFSSTTDINLADVLFNGAATTSIGGLSEDTQYSFSVFAYDTYGHVSSSTRLDVTTNKTPLAKFNSAAARRDGTGVVDISTDVYDKNHDESKMKIEYEAGASCLFAQADAPTLDQSQSNIYASLGVPYIDNGSQYQIGTTSGHYIVTTATNTVAFDWLSAGDLDNIEGDYCLRITANDNINDQNEGATTTVAIDNKTPDAPGDLSNGGVSTSTVILVFAAPASDANFREYKIFYKEGTSGVTENDIEFSSTTDENLGDRLFNGFGTTTVTGLNPNTDYVFNIWAYDYYGHKISASEITIGTNAYITNESLTFINPDSSNIALADETTEWIFRAVVSDEEGWTSLFDCELRLQNKQDSVSPYDDLKFVWDQTTQTFTETGSDSLGMAALSGNSTSTCALNTCTLDFALVFDKNFASTSVNYIAELYSTNDSLASDEDAYGDFYQVRLIRLEQIHYRWRNDDGGE